MTAPVKNLAPQPLVGLPAVLAGQPLSSTLRGGPESGITGISTLKAPTATAPEPADAPEAPGEFAGMGPWLEEDDTTVFKTLHGLVKRQEILANNRWNIDLYFTTLKLGYTWGTLSKAADQDVYTFSLPYGVTKVEAQPIPNKMWDLVNKATSTLLTNFPQFDAKGIDSSEQAEQAAKFANRYLTIDGGELGTNDRKTFTQAVEHSLTCASSFVQLFNDPSGNGWVPLQIKAHPTAVSPETWEVGADGSPTTDYLLRYVTDQQQFTDDPSQAAKQWLPKTRARVLGREHVRVFPETVTAQEAEKVIVLYYATVGEGKRWFSEMADMADDQIDAICDWTPAYYLRLLPSSLRARWRLSDGDTSEKAGTGDERYFFFYEAYARSTPEHPNGAHVVMNGAASGTCLHKETWHVDVEQSSTEGTAPVTEPKQLGIAVIQLTPRLDADERDATGRCYVEIFEGAVRYQANLYQSFGDATDKALHPARFGSSTSPVQGWQIEDSRATNNIITVLRPEDYPKYEEPPVLPGNVEAIMDRTTEAIDSAANLNKPAQGSDTSNEVSGVARQIAVQQSTIGLGPLSGQVNDAMAAYGRSKLELGQKYMTAPQQLRFSGEDGQQQQVEYSAVDFGLIGDVVIKQGTGNMQPPEARLNFIGTQLQLGLISPEDASEASRQDYSAFIAQDDNVHEQYIERCIGAWLKGPPEGWDQQFAMYQQQMQQYQAATGPVMAEAQMQAQQAELNGQAPAPPPDLPPPPPAPWSPFAARPNDTEPEVAILWKRRLSKLISSVKYEQMAQLSPGWTQALVDKYMVAVQASAPAPMVDPNQPPQKPPSTRPPQGAAA